MANRPESEPAPNAGEKSMLCGWMDCHREMILATLDALNDDAIRERLVPSETTLLGIVKHLALAEHYWFVQVFAGEDDGLPRPDAGWDTSNDSTEDIVRLYRTSCDRSRGIVDAASLDDVARWGTVTNRRGTQDFSLRWILTHMIEETAQHNGHADILREQILAG